MNIFTLLHRCFRTRASTSANVWCSFTYHAHCDTGAALSLSNRSARRTMNEYISSNAGVVRAMARSFHCRCVSTPRCVRTSWNGTSTLRHAGPDGRDDGGGPSLTPVRAMVPTWCAKKAQGRYCAGGWPLRGSLSNRTDRLLSPWQGITGGHKTSRDQPEGWSPEDPGGLPRKDCQGVAVCVRHIDAVGGRVDSDSPRPLSRRHPG